MSSHCAPDCFRCDHCQGVYHSASHDGGGGCVDCFATLCKHCFHIPEDREKLMARGVDRYDAGRRGEPLCHYCWSQREPEYRSQSVCDRCEEKGAA